MKEKMMILAMIVFILTFVSSTAKADTIMFPYINTFPGNVATVISTINGTSAIYGYPVGALHYRYVTKPHTAGTLDPCEEVDFCRVTSFNDVVTFDAAGNTGTLYNSGNAMFGDPGAGTTFGGAIQVTYEGPFNETQTPQPRIGYLLVTHHLPTGFRGVTCGAGDLPDQGELDGEATLIDIVNGEAWGYRAALNSTTGLGTTSADGGNLGSNYAFWSSDETLFEGGHSFFENTGIWPPNQFTTRYFVTPLYINVSALSGGTNVGTNDSMAATAAAFQKRTRVSLRGYVPTVAAAEPQGVFNRNEVFRSGGTTVHVRCVAAISLSTLIGGISNYNEIAATGGWATFDLSNPVPIAADNEGTIPDGGYDAFVYDLKFTQTGPMLGASGLTNDGKIIRSRAPVTAPRENHE